MRDRRLSPPAPTAPTTGPLLVVALLALLTLQGCGQDEGGADTGAGTAADSGATDSGPADTGAADTGAVDSGAPDTGTADTAPADSGATDAGNADTGDEDAGTTDASPLEDGQVSDASADASTSEDAGLPPLDGAGSGDVGLAGDTTDAVSGPQPCSPALAIAPAKGQTLPYDLRTFKGSGGTGAYRFDWVKNASGAVLNKLTGAYLSGDKTGVTDVVRMSDLGCVGHVDAKMNVVEPLTMAPLAPQVPYKQKIAFTVTQGSGKFTFSLKANKSGATLGKSSGVYTAGSKDGDDQVQVLDTATGETSTAVVKVRKGATLVARPPRIAVPVGTTVTLQVAGGSGHRTLQLPNGPFKAGKGLQVSATAVGVVNAKVKDTYTGAVVNVQLRGVKGVEPILPSVGDGYQAAHVRRVPDLDGDGYDEAVVSLAEADHGFFNAGAVFVYKGSKTGLVTKPVQILHGTSIDARYGYGIAVADVDGDKRADLLVGSPYADEGSSNSGAVYVHRGLKSGKFSATAKWVLKGQYSSDQLGWGIAACDMNGDGLTDVAAGAIYAEDRDANPIVSSTGGVYVWLGHADGFLDKPDLRRYLQLPDGKGGFKSVANTRIGWDVAGGDTNGDGVCDIAVSSLYYKGNTNNDGLIALYLGQKADAKGLGGPTARPIRLWSGAESGQSGSQLGRSMAMADVDGDGKDELIAGQLNWRGKPAKTGRGAVRVFDVGTSNTKAANKIDPASASTWMVEGPNSYDYAGYRVSAADIDGDGIAEVLSQEGNGEVSGGKSNAGVVQVFRGKKGAMPDKTPWKEWPGAVGGDYFGLGMAAIADRDGDKLAELVVFAGQDDTTGYNLGQPWLVPSKTGLIGKSGKNVALQMPNPASGAFFGRAVAFLGDLNGDGYAELAVGSPYEAANKAAPGAKTPLWVGTRSGMARVYKGTATGVDTKAPVWRAVGFPGHSAHDYVGWAMAGGDFDGDKQRDVVVMARAEDRPSSFSSAYIKGSKCSGSRSNVSATYVFQGTKGGWPKATPKFVMYGPKTSNYADSVATGMDVNGDGYDDVVIGSVSWDATGRSNAGGWAMFPGRKPNAAAGIQVICGPSYTYVSGKSNDAVGRSVAPLGDLDGDGCDEFAVGGDAEDHGLSNQGVVHIVYGWGDKCASKTPREVGLKGGSSNARAGTSVASGGDVDGDGVGDLAVGGYAFSNGSATVGTAWIVTGAYLKTLKPKPIVDGQPPAVLVPIADPGSKARLSVTGVTNGGQFGWSVALLPGLEKDGRAGLLVGIPNGTVHAKPLSGGGEVFRWLKSAAAPGLTLHPVQAIAGEGHRAGSRVGFAVTGAATKSAGPTVILGGFYATPSGSKQVNMGAIYAAPLPKF